MFLILQGYNVKGGLSAPLHKSPLLIETRIHGFVCSQKGIRNGPDALLLLCAAFRREPRLFIRTQVQPNEGKAAQAQEEA